ncbi:MAG: hypothetical protein AAF958_02070 [Planctomycetota bacterium]
MTRRSTFLFFAVWCLLGGLPLRSSGGEPAEDFVKALRNAGYSDTALLYLETVSELPGVNPEFLKSIEFERAQIFFDLARTARKPQDMESNLEKTEAALREFLGQGDHPRREEAQLQLGALLLTRGEQKMRDDPTPQQREQARELYVKAATTFTEITDRLREELQTMRGAAIDPSTDPEAADRRDRFRGQYLSGLVQTADANKLAAETFEEPGKDGKDLLEKSLQGFTELSEKYSKKYVVGITADASIGEIQEILGNAKKAEAAYTRMMEAGEGDELRPAQFRAAAGLIRLAVAASPPDFARAGQIGKPLVDRIRPNERESPEANQLQLEYAKANLAFSKTEAAKGNDKKKAISEARQALNRIAKVSGSHNAEAKTLLADLGIKVDDDETLPTTAQRPESIDDALGTARDLMQAVATYQETLDSGNPASGTEDYQRISTQASQARQVAVDVLRQGLAMVNRESDAQTVQSARELLAYAAYDDSQFYEAIAVGEFLARTAPGNPSGLSGGLIAMNGYSALLREDPANKSLTESLSTLAGYLTQTWPNNPDAAGAGKILIKLSLQNEQWDRAEAQIDGLKNDAVKSSMRCLLGRLLYIDADQTRREKGQEIDREMLAKAETLIRQGLNDLPADLLDLDAAKAALTLAKVQRKLDKYDDAAETLASTEFGPAKLREQLKIKDEAFELDLLTTQLYTNIGRLSSGGDPGTILPQAMQVLDDLEKRLDGDQLTALYLTMARSVREQIDEAQPARRNQLVEAFRQFLQRVAGSTDKTETLLWAGQTLADLGEAAMPTGVAKASGESAELLKTAIDIFARVQSAGGDFPLTVYYQHGRALRLVGEYKKAADQLEKMLQQKPNMLTAQVEAALTYEQWADSFTNKKIAVRAYQSAMGGARPDANKQKVIWGWGKLSRITNGREQFRDTFFEARYHIALCRFKQGRAADDQKIIAKAIQDITQIAALFPDMGGPESWKRFDALLRTVQKAAGKPVTGLKNPGAVSWRLGTPQIIIREDWIHPC